MEWATEENSKLVDGQMDGRTDNGYFEGLSVYGGLNKIFFNWDSFHARLTSRYKAWSYKKKEHKKIKAYRKSL